MLPETVYRNAQREELYEQSHSDSCKAIFKKKSDFLADKLLHPTLTPRRRP